MENRRSEDQQLGFDKAPDRYSRGGRETIDLIRDAMTDVQFIAYCWGNVIRYRDRAGAKGPAEIDEEKARFYEQMAIHVQDTTTWGETETPDPRAYRDGFAPYVRQHYPDGLHHLLTLTHRLLTEP